MRSRNAASSLSVSIVTPECRFHADMCSGSAQRFCSAPWRSRMTKKEVYGKLRLNKVRHRCRTQQKRRQDVEMWPHISKGLIRALRSTGAYSRCALNAFRDEETAHDGDSRRTSPSARSLGEISS